MPMSTTANKIRTWYHNLAINRKLLLTFALALFLPLVCICIYNIVYSNHLLREQLVRYYQHAFTQAGSQADAYLSRMRQSANLTAQNALIEIVSKDPQHTTTIE